MVETTVSEVPKVGFKIPIVHVKRVMKNPFTEDGTKSAREHVETIEDITFLVCFKKNRILYHKLVFVVTKSCFSKVVDVVCDLVSKS